MSKKIDELVREIKSYRQCDRCPQGSLNVKYHLVDKYGVSMDIANQAWQQYLANGGDKAWMKP